MKIVFFGSSNFSIPVLKALMASKHSVVQVVTTPDKKQGRGQKIGASVIKTFAVERGLSVLTPDKLSVSAVIDEIKRAEPDFMVVASYGKLIPTSVFTLAKIAPLNVHPSLLPRHRGASPVQQAILEGDQETGVSVAEIIKELDAGDVFAQEKTEIGENENALELENRLATVGAKLVLDVIKRLEAGTISRTPQESSKSTYAKKITSDAGHINWTRSAKEIHNQVRAYFLWPSAFTLFHGKRLKILETRKIVGSSSDFNRSEDLNLRYDVCGLGSIAQIDRSERFIVQTGNGFLELVRVQLEGRKEMSAFDFAVGQRIQKGDKFESS